MLAMFALTVVGDQARSHPLSNHWQPEADANAPNYLHPGPVDNPHCQEVRPPETSAGFHFRLNVCHDLSFRVLHSLALQWFFVQLNKNRIAFLESIPGVIPAGSIWQKPHRPAGNECKYALEYDRYPPTGLIVPVCKSIIDPIRQWNARYEQYCIESVCRTTVSNLNASLVEVSRDSTGYAADSEAGNKATDDELRYAVRSCLDY